jgi:phosphate:Na+ symporter
VFDIGAVAAVIGFIGIMMSMLIKNEKVATIGNILVGLGLIFIGIEFMSTFAKQIMFANVSEKILHPWVETIFKGDHFPLLLVLIGIVLTALVHSSSTITSIMVVLASIGVLSFDNALFLALGSNIGTCITSLMSSAGANVNAKRTAGVHLAFNLLGCLLFLAPIWIWKGQVASLFASMSSDVGQQIAIFHTLFNVVTTLVLLPFSTLIVKLVSKIIPEKQEDEDILKLSFIDSRMLSTPPIAAANVKKEIVRMADLAKENVKIAETILLDDEGDLELFAKNEELINFLNRNVTAFLTKLMGADLSAKEDKIIGSYYHVISDIERVGDYAENITEYAERLKNEEKGFSAHAKEELREVFENVLKLFDLSMTAFEKEDIKMLAEIDEIENKIDEASLHLEEKHISRLKKGSCTPQTGSIYLQTVSNLERVGDHITNVSTSIKNYVAPAKQVQN